MFGRKVGSGRLRGVLCGLALVPVLALGQSCGAAASQRGWVISQSTKLNGDLVIYLGSESMRVDCVSVGVSVLVHKDSPKVLLWNPQSHKRFETDWHHLTPIGGTNVLTSGYLAALPLEKRPVTTSSAIAGMESMQFSMLKSARCPLKSPAATDGVVGSAMVPHTGLSDAQFWVSTKLPISESECQVIRRITCLPPVGGIPLRLLLKTDTGAICKELDTTKAVQQSLPVSTFAEPKDCAPAKNEQEVCFNSTRLKRLMNVFDSWRDIP